MTFVPMTASILSPLYNAFSWIMQQLYFFLYNYAAVIFIFTVFLRAILIPLGVQQHKNTLRMQALSPQIDDLKRLYGKDKQGLQMATMELYKKHKISQLSGCLPMLLSLFIIWPIYRIVSAPLHYFAGVSYENLEKVGNYLHGIGQITDSQLKNLSIQDIPILRALQEHAQSFTHVVNEGWMKASDLLDLRLGTTDLGITPTVSLSKLFGDEWKVYLPLMGLVLLAVLTTFLSSKIAEVANPMYHKLKEEKALAKQNPARTAPTDMTQQGMMKGMKYTMPLVTLIISLSTPSAMTIYWIATNLIMIVQQLLLYKLYTQGHHKRMSQKG